MREIFGIHSIGFEHFGLLECYDVTGLTDTDVSKSSRCFRKSVSVTSLHTALHPQKARIFNLTFSCLDSICFPFNLFSE